MFELVIYKGKKYFASVLDLYVRKDEIILDTIECLGKISKDFDKTKVYNADPFEVCTVTGEDVKSIIKTGRYFLYEECLDGFGNMSVYIDGTALMEQMNHYKQDITPDNFIQFAHFHKDEIDLAYEFEDFLKRMEQHKKELEEGNDND